MCFMYDGGNLADMSGARETGGGWVVTSPRDFHLDLCVKASECTQRGPIWRRAWALCPRQRGRGPRQRAGLEGCVRQASEGTCRNPGVRGDLSSLQLVGTERPARTSGQLQGELQSFGNHFLSQPGAPDTSARIMPQPPGTPHPHMLLCE